MKTAATLRLPAIEVRQGRSRVLYSFAVDGKLLPRFASVSRIARDGERIAGYQRPEVLAHVAEIRTYLESDNPLIPNAIVVAFDKRVKFEPHGGPDADTAYSRLGTLLIPVASDDEATNLPGWIVDGQQRAAAIRDAKVKRFPVCVVGFKADRDHEQREQFILVNSTRPLPKGLVYELLPATSARLPSPLQRRRFPTALLDRLNLDADSPLKGLIRTQTLPGGVVKDNSVIKMLENSLTDGLLFRFRGENGERGDVEPMLAAVKDFWWAVADVFKPAWGLPPRRSRLMHGAGMIGLGFVMDAIADRYRGRGTPTREQFKANLVPLVGVCRWTEGEWNFGPGAVRKWNEVQNTPKDVQTLSNYLLDQYKALVWTRQG